MGLAMATNLQKHLATKSTLNSLLYSNRTMSRGESLKALGAKPETNFSELVAQCGIIFTMVSRIQLHCPFLLVYHADRLTKDKVSNDDALRSLVSSVTEDPTQSLKDKIFVDCSTVHPQTVGLTVAKLKEKQADFLAAPVFGGNPIAVDGKLVFAIAGPKRASDIVKPLIQDIMGRKVIDCGEDATKSSMLKIAG
jgi:3-hydroxyisobutyrate dehydrogenase-like beta-hydroxyacid dehydrogenase